MIKTRHGAIVGSGADKAAPRSMRVYRFADLRLAGVFYTRKHVRDLENRGEFPVHFQLGPNSVGWVAEEVDEWVEARIRSRRAPAVPSESATPAPRRQRAA